MYGCLPLVPASSVPLPVSPSLTLIDERVMRYIYADADCQFFRPAVRHVSHNGGSPFCKFSSIIGVLLHANGPQVDALYHWISTGAGYSPV